MRQKSNYKILNLVGRGQFGKVFVAIERGYGTLVALKEFNPKQLSTSSFLRELNFLVTLDHFNIVNCRALEHRQNNRYIVMDYCEGGTLRDLLQCSPQLSLEQSLKLIINILSGLKFAHSKGIIHRDIKPENILLKVGDRGWTAHISDFGIAKLNQEINPHGVMGDTGSPAYMAPEQFYGQYSYSCDLYAVGVILYELVVGERPFSGMPKELLAAHLNQAVTIPQQVPFFLRSVIAKALQKMPQRRFRSAAEMLESLKLAQTILQAEDNPQVFSTFKLHCNHLTPTSVAIPAPRVNNLEIASELVYLGHDNQLQLQLYQDASLTGAIVNQWSITLDQPIRNLQVDSLGCWVGTQSSIYYIPRDTNSKEFRFFIKTSLPVASFATANLVTSINALGYWLAVSYLPQKSRTPVFEIYKSPNCQLKRSQINLKPWQTLIALDNRRGLAIYYDREQQTEFSLFNRRGNWLATFTVQAQLDLIIYNPQFDQQVLTTEIDNPGSSILINIAKFRVKRIELDIAPALAISYPQGYLLGNDQGRMVLVDGDSHLVHHFQLPVPNKSKVTAIAVSQTQLLVAFTSEEKSYLQRFSWQQVTEQINLN
ncbi:MAG: serine/threonine-protein kinase [Cyanobacteria bacterium P01_G01_bin.67]